MPFASGVSGTRVHGGTFYRRWGDHLDLFSESTDEQAAGVSKFLVAISGFKNFKTHEPGCTPADPTAEGATRIPPSITDWPFRFKYSFFEVRPALICLDSTGREIDSDICRQQAADNTVGDYGVRLQAIPESEGGRIGVLNYPQVDKDQNHIWAFNLAELLHPFPPPRNPTTCQDDKSEAYVIYGLNIFNIFYGAEFDPVPPGAIDTDNILDYQFIVEITEVPEFINGQTVRYFSWSGQHSGSC